MAMNKGDIDATTGIAKDIYDVFNREIISTFPKEMQSKKEAEDGLKKMAYCIAEGVIKHIKENIEIIIDKDKVKLETTLNTSLNNIFTAGVPVPMDGGLALQTAWKLNTAGGVADGATQKSNTTIKGSDNLIS